VCAAAVVGSLFMIREALFAGVVNTLGNVKTAGLTGVTPSSSIFPNYMIPSGLANLLGLLPIGQYTLDPWLSAIILLAIVLLAVVLLQAASDLRKEHVYAAMLVLMAGIGLSFFRGANDYGLFKVAMFCQPALAAALAFLSLRLFRRWWRVAPLLALAGTVPAQLYYTLASAGAIGGGVVEIPDASRLGVTFDVPTISAISDICFVPAQGLAALVFRGSNVLYPSVARGKFADSALAAEAHSARAVTPVARHVRSSGRFAAAARIPSPGVSRTTLMKIADQGGPAAVPARAHEIPAHPHSGDTVPLGGSSFRERIAGWIDTVRWAATFPVRKFETAGREQETERRRQMAQANSVWNSEFFGFAPELLRNVGPTHLLTLRQRFVFNASAPAAEAADYGMFRVVPYESVRNWLVFIPSSRGPDYFYSRFSAAFYQPEPDPYRPDAYMAAVGRFLLFQVVHPAERLRLRISLSRSILGPGRTELPKDATIDADSTEPLPFVGSGSAVIYSAPVKPVQKDGLTYVAVDFNVAPTAFPNRKSGLMNLYNREFAVDHRRLVGFGRDISAISEDEYEQMKRPKRLDRFPHGLLSEPGIEYSGIYEDGWISQDAFINLGAAHSGESVYLEGSVPALAALANGVTMKVAVNDAPAAVSNLKPGAFRVRVPVTDIQALTRIRIGFSAVTALPGGDTRMVAALLRSVSIE
jgi:hypothetical protein